MSWTIYDVYTILLQLFHSLTVLISVSFLPYLRRFPWLGVEKAEIITALCSMLHGPLAKEDNQAFASIKNIIDSIAANPLFMQYADLIAQLFLDRFRYTKCIWLFLFQSMKYVFWEIMTDDKYSCRWNPSFHSCLLCSPLLLLRPFYLFSCHIFLFSSYF